MLRGPCGSLAYAVSVHFEDGDLAARVRVMEALRILGLDLLEHVH